MRRRRQVPAGKPKQDPNTGSPGQGEPVFLAVGRLRRSHGLAGEMLMDVLTGFPERIQPGKIVFVGETHEPIAIVGVRGHNRELIIHLAGLETPEDTGRFRNATVYVKSTELPKLPEGEYYHHQLLGSKVVDEAGQELGSLTDILETGANDVYLVKTPDGKELLLPAVVEVILEVNLKRHEIRVRPPQWL